MAICLSGPTTGKTVLAERCPSEFIDSDLVLAEHFPPGKDWDWWQTIHNSAVGRDIKERAAAEMLDRAEEDDLWILTNFADGFGGLFDFHTQRDRSSLIVLGLLRNPADLAKWQWLGRYAPDDDALVMPAWLYLSDYWAGESFVNKPIVGDQELVKRKSIMKRKLASLSKLYPQYRGEISDVAAQLDRL